jgi:hypothetical protein
VLNRCVNLKYLHLRPQVGACFEFVVHWQYMSERLLCACFLLKRSLFVTMASLLFSELGLRIVGYGFQGLGLGLGFRVSPSMR